MCRFKKVSSTVVEKDLELEFCFGLPPFYKGGPETGRVWLPIPKKYFTNYFQKFVVCRMPLLYPRRILIIDKKDVYVEVGAGKPAPMIGALKARMFSPRRFDDC